MNDILKTQHSFARKADARPDHRFGDLYHLICRKEWLESALNHVLSNTGARTAGVDGIDRKALRTVKEQQDFITDLQAELKAGTYQPQPVRRVWIDKPGKTEKRGLGIPTLRDRVIQEVLRMLLEPIWESDFLDCSSGFRPGRRTMDCIAMFYSRVQTQNRFFWAIEGDIRKCFDRIHHSLLLKQIRKRIADEQIVQLVKAFLTAGVMEEALFQDTHEGTPQGGILSPLLANIYLHQLDVWWWQKFGNLTPGQKQYRRRSGQGNAILVRYADDFVLLWNGTHQAARNLKEELKQFLWDELHLELSEEKTQITHMTDGIDFLGFHIQYMLPTQGRKPWLRVTPTQRNLQRFKAKVKALTSRGTTYATSEMRFKGLNRVIRGWGNYYRHVSFTHHASKLDFWMGQRILNWLRSKHPKRGVRSLLKQYLLREVKKQYNRDNFGVQAIDGETVFIAKLGDIRLTPYRWTKRPNPYLVGDHILKPEEAERPFLDPRVVNLPPSALRWKKQRARAMRRDKGKCQHCGAQCKLMDVHHVISREQSGTDEMDNLITLCRTCHSKTSTYGFNATREERV